MSPTTAPSSNINLTYADTEDEIRACFEVMRELAAAPRQRAGVGLSGGDAAEIGIPLGGRARCH